MDEIEVKHEFDSELQAQCHACLSVGRKLMPIAEYSNIYKKLTSGFMQPVNIFTEPVAVCWECHALLRRVVQFQFQVHRANEMLQLGQNFLYGPLSSLTTVILNDKHPHTIYINETSIQTDRKIEQQVKPNIHENLGNSCDMDFNDSCLQHGIVGIKQELKHNININKVKHNNRWAKKRAIQNKKPKFRIVTQKCETFKKVLINNEELMIRFERKRDSAYYKSKKYKCENCVLGFNKEDSLVKHNERFHLKNIGSYICDICHTKLQDKGHLSTHISNHYYKYECTLCEYICHSKRQKRLHTQKKHRRLFQCIKCDLMFCSRREFYKHFKDWHEKFICDYCGISFKMRYCLKDHIRKQHSPFECKACNKTFARYNGLWLHNKLCHSPPGQTAYCVECDKRYVDIYRYRWHLANSAKHKPRQRLRIPCPSCDKVFSKNIYMKDHYNLVHLKFIKYRCEECDKNFIRNADLVKHKRRVHEGILPPKNKICYMCGRGFTTNKILTNHLRTHTGERPFACRECPQRFAQRAALASHTRSIHHKCKK